MASFGVIAKPSASCVPTPATSTPLDTTAFGATERDAPVIEHSIGFAGADVVPVCVACVEPACVADPLRNSTRRRRLVPRARDHLDHRAEQDADDERAHAQHRREDPARFALGAFFERRVAALQRRHDAGQRARRAISLQVVELRAALARHRHLRLGDVGRGELLRRRDVALRKRRGRRRLAIAAARERIRRHRLLERRAIVRERVRTEPHHRARAIGGHERRGLHDLDARLRRRFRRAQLLRTRRRLRRTLRRHRRNARDLRRLRDRRVHLHDAFAPRRRTRHRVLHFARLGRRHDDWRRVLRRRHAASSAAARHPRSCPARRRT